ncbi:leucine rich repeat LRR-containing protein [Nitzschia inconspicua]|uniref:Leucine rich repeat LRR-containing protein n=1 Tax=Nitzschia inconspicua TaxID=303405 RepID=A0A9K3LQ19_9STRA|nr:leucine rich repeat LRR-containing protein [Nitzschia inconspicua]
MNQFPPSEYVHSSCLPGLELMLQHGLLSLDRPYTAASEQSMWNEQGKLGLIPDTLTTTTFAVAESKVDEASPMPSLVSSWNAQAKQAVQFDQDGYVIFLDLGGRRLHRGYPCSIPDTIGTFSRLATLNVAGSDLPLPNILEILRQPNLPETLECLYLGGNGLGDEGIAAIATEFLSRSQKLIKLDLRYNDIQAKGMTVLCHELSPTALKHLYLEGNQVGNQGAAALAKLLEEQSSCDDDMGLREVFLGANRIESEGANCLAQSLYKNKKLSKLYLEGNNIGLEGANAFSTVLEELKGNTSLKNLYVDNNTIGKEGSKRLANALNSDTAIGESII